MKEIYQPIPFWSWNSELDENQLTNQIEWMHDRGIGGFFMHARGGLTTPYLGDKWFSCVKACLEKAKELNMQAYAYDENGWPSGFAGGKLLEKEEYRDCYLEYKYGAYDPNSFVAYDYSGDKLIRVTSGNDVLNVYCVSSISTADILNKEVVKKFIDITHEQYKKNDPNHLLKGFFTDEPQYQRWHHPYTHCLEQYFKDNYNEDILDSLGLMFIEKDNYRSFRYKYWKAMQTLMLDSFAKQIYSWCEENKYALTGHYVEESNLYQQMENCAGIMPFYAYEHIPGMDWLGRDIGNDLAPKQLGSVAAQLDKKQVLTESFAMVGWDTTPEELKHIFEWQAVQGVSLLCHHLLPISEKGQRKRDYPLHYSSINPWAESDFKLFNDEMTRIGEIISNSEEQVRVGVIHPIRSCYFDYKRANEYESVKPIEDNIRKLMLDLGSNHIPYHFIDETLLKDFGGIKDDSICVGKCSYDIIILPLMYTMDKNTETVLKQYVSNGGKVFLYRDKPTYLEGEEYNYDYLHSCISFEEIVNSKPFISSFNKDIRISYRKDNKGDKFFYIVNLGEATSITLNGHQINFNKWESKFIDENEIKNDEVAQSNIILLNKPFKVIGKPTNFYTLDEVRYSFDNKEFSNSQPVLGVFDHLLETRFQGELYLKYEFEVKSIPSECFSLIENQYIISVYINGTEVSRSGSVLEDDLFKYDICKYLKIGTNEIVVHINFIEGEDVYYALYGENVTETLRNCLTYPTTIESIYLMGNFGVFGGFKQGQEDNVLIGQNFYIDTPKETIKCLIEEGYPFFRGKIHLETSIDVENIKDVTLSIPNRFSLLEISINDQQLPPLMFGHQIDISKYVKLGINKVDIVLTVSNRNLLGPHHYASKEECIEVGPFTFERKGSWQNGESPKYRKTYSFVKTII